MRVYADSNLFSRFYLRLSESEEAVGWMQAAQAEGHAPLPVTWLHRLKITQFEELALRHTAKHGFRTYDLIHVASALVLRCDTFWSFDPKASKLASLEGLRLR